MKRRQRRRPAASSSSGHHNVYVVLLDDAVLGLGKVQRVNPDRDPGKPAVYVGLTGLDPEQRFENHQRGIRSVSLVQRYGVRLMPERYAYLNPMPYEAAAQMERDLAEDLRRAGYTVLGGH